MKPLITLLFCMSFSIMFSSCSLMTYILTGEHAEDTKVEKMTSRFSLSDNLVYINYYNSTPTYSTFVIDAEKMDVVSRIYYANGKYEHDALQVSPYNNRLWMLGVPDKSYNA